MKFLNCIKLLKSLCSAGRPFHTRTTRSVKKYLRASMLLVYIVFLAGLIFEIHLAELIYLISVYLLGTVQIVLSLKQSMLLFKHNFRAIDSNYVLK